MYLVEAGGEELLKVTKPGRNRGLDTGVAVNLLGEGASPGVDGADLLVLAGGSEEAAVTLPGDGVDHIREGDRELGGSGIQVPDLELRATSGRQNLRGSRVEGQGLDLLVVSLEHEERLCQVALQAFLRDPPKANLTSNRSPTC